LQKFKQFIISTKPFNVDILSGLIWQFDITGIIENDSSLTVFAKETASVNTKILNAFLLKLKREELISEFEMQSSLFEDQNWNKEWEKKTPVLEVTDHIVIKPTITLLTK